MLAALAAVRVRARVSACGGVHDAISALRGVVTATTTAHYPQPARAHAAVVSGDGGLTAQQLFSFHANGFVVVQGFASAAQCDTLRAAAERVIEESDLSRVPVFRAHDASTHTKYESARYFFDSAERVCVFLEDKALLNDGRVDPALPKSRAVNKIAHALAEQVPEFREFSFQPRVAAILRSLGYEAPAIVQSMYICKQPTIGGEVFLHQDNAFLRTTPYSVVGFWVAIEDACIDNGCLEVIPGSHGTLASHFVHRGNDVTEFTAPQPSWWAEARRVPVCVPAGSLVLLHGNVVHSSKPNTSPASRHAYTFHVAESKLPWAADNWLQRTTPFARIY